MKIDADDPKWTAYVLGELDDREREEIELLLESSADARTLVDELKVAATMMKDELAPQESLLLTPQQRAGLHAAAGRVRTRRWFTPRFTAWATGAAAAGLILAAVMMPSLLRSRQTAEQEFAVVGPQGAPETMAQEAVAPAEAEVTVVPDTANTEGGLPDPGVQVQTAQAVEEFAALETQSSPEVREAKISPNQSDSIRVRDTSAAPPPPPPAANPSAVLFNGNAGQGVLGNVIRQTQSSAGLQAFTSVAGSFANGESDVRRLNDQFRTGFDIQRPSGTAAYDRIVDNPFIALSENSLATLSIDVDTASYANMRRFLSQNQLPPKDAVRIEELINYFSYDYARPNGQHPVAAHVDIASAPWNPEHRLVRVGIKAKEIDVDRRPASNLVFLIDVSGSMAPPEKLQLLKSAMKLLVDRLTENDRVSLVVYAGASGLVLPPTTGDKKETILRALENLHAGGSTNGASGIQLAYDIAVGNFIRGGINRVILATDGDFNVGVTSQGDLTRLIEDKAKSGVFLSVLGFGMGNLKDSTLEKLADTGNGHYAYIDTLNEGRKVLVEEMGGTLVTVAKDVKIQVEFNPAQVNGYRLIGYENRILAAEDFNNDLKDAGDMGSGHTVTALFEVVPRGVNMPAPSIDPLKYQAPAAAPARSASPETLTLKVRYKDPDGSDSRLLEVPLTDRGARFESAGADFRFAASVAAFGMILRDSPYKGNASLDAVLQMSQAARGADRSGYREEFIGLVRRARSLRQ